MYNIQNRMKEISGILPGFDHGTPLYAHSWDSNKADCKADADGFSFDLYGGLERNGLNDEIADAFKGQVVIELGCGNPLNGSYGIEVVSMLGAKAYIGADAFNLDNIEYSEKRFSDKYGIPIFLVTEDMYSFMKRVPGSSVSVFASGIDIDVLESPEYRANVSAEIQRTIHDDGCFISFNCDLAPRDMNISFVKTGDTDTSFVVKYTK